MNNNALTELMHGIGMLTELWIIAYRGFTAQGLCEAEAMKHTRGFMEAMIDSITKMPNDGQEGSK